MDSRDFDNLTRRLASSSSRRGVLRAGLAIVGAAVGLGAARETDAARKRSLGNTCKANADCVSNLCVTQSRGRKVCGCQSAADCPAAKDVCHAATCANGACGIAVDPNAVNGPCNDGNACTHNDVCTANGKCAGTPVACTALDQCHVAGTCNPATGQCSNPQADFGAPCDDGNACTTGDHCVLGQCVGTSIICQPVDDPASCWNQPSCNPATGVCSQATPKANGTPCDDGDLCTTSVCDGAGTCAGTPKNCGGSIGACPQKCDPTTGACVAGGNGDACIPSSFGQCQTGVCQDGGCVVAPASVGSPCLIILEPANPCQTGICNSSGDCGAAPVDDGMACAPSSQLDECQSGICQSGACVILNALDGTTCGDSVAAECDRQSCQAGVCTNASRLDQRCEVQLHGCMKFTCQPGGCLDSGTTDDCASTNSCGHGTCVEDPPGVGECHDDLGDGYACEGVCFSEPVECCGIALSVFDTSTVITCPLGSGRQCCTGLLGAQCCEPHVECLEGGCGTPAIDVPGG